jgi:hypothetical protein
MSREFFLCVFLKPAISLEDMGELGLSNDGGGETARWRGFDVDRSRNEVGESGWFMKWIGEFDCILSCMKESLGSRTIVVIDVFREDGNEALLLSELCMGSFEEVLCEKVIGVVGKDVLSLAGRNIGRVIGYGDNTKLFLWEVKPEFSAAAAATSSCPVLSGDRSLPDRCDPAEDFGCEKQFGDFEVWIPL